MHMLINNWEAVMKRSEKLTYSVPEAAEILGIGRSQGYLGVKSGDIPSIRIGKRIVVPKEALERLLLGGRQA